MKQQNNFKLIGVMGRINSGKSTVATAFAALGFDTRAFADPLKLFVHELFDIPREVLWGPSENRTGEVRQMLQELGTDYARKFRPNVWIDKMRDTILRSSQNGAPGLTVPDVRFVNEAQMLRENNATLIHILRPQSGAHETAEANAHQSEVELCTIPEEWVTHTIHNDGDLDALQPQVQAIIAKMTWK